MHRLRFILYTVLALMLIASGAFYASAQSADELRDKINNAQEQIDKLDDEIAQLEKDLQKVGADRTTLEAAIKELNLTRQKLLNDITVTQKKIEKSGYTIQQLGIAITDKQTKIERNSRILADALRTVREADDQSLIENVLTYDSLSDLWIELDQLGTVRNTVRDQLLELKGLKDELQTQKAAEQQEHDNLSAYKSKLSGQKQAIEAAKKQKDTLLTTTKSTEAQYQAQLALKKQQQKQFESELQDYEAKLKYISDPSKLPQKGSGVLGWPVEHPLITQGFGITSFAAGGAYGYDASGKPNPHRGIDFNASIGTAILAAADGVVRDAVDMDKSPGCYSYGKWILIDHDNGLSTLYAHLSVFSVSAGQTVKKGQIIGYSGQSGYATGPHLHFTVFDQSAAKVDYFSWSNGCKGTKVAYAPYEAYLNPLSYLPQQ